MSRLWIWFDLKYSSLSKYSKELFWPSRLSTAVHLCSFVWFSIGWRIQRENFLPSISTSHTSTVRTCWQHSKIKIGNHHHRHTTKIKNHMQCWIRKLTHSPPTSVHISTLQTFNAPEVQNTLAPSYWYHWSLRNLAILQSCHINRHQPGYRASLVPVPRLPHKSNKSEKEKVKKQSKF